MRLAIGTLGLAAGLGAAGCSAADKILDVPPPVGQTTIDNVETQAGAEQLYATAASRFETIFTDGSSGIVFTTETLSDQFSGFQAQQDIIDARRLEWTSDFGEYVGPNALGPTMLARSMLVLSIHALSTYETPDGMYRVGEAYARLGYTELILAEAFCSGVTLDQITFGGGIEYAHPITTDSLFALAIAHFDSALAHANGNTTIQALANTGKGRAFLGRGKFTEAATAAALVPTGFVFNVGVGNNKPIVNWYGDDPCGGSTIEDHEGGTGLDYVSAHDPRLVVHDSLCSVDYRDYTWHVQWTDRYGYPATFMPIASGVEARLIEAEAKVSANDASWIDDINALRTTCLVASSCMTDAPAGTGGVAGLPPLTAPANADSSVAMVFRERAFWLFGQGSRLGDMRRLVKFHHRPSETVYPTGAYSTVLYHPQDGYSPMTTYGTDISIPLPTETAIRNGAVAITNPYYKGCLGSASAD